MNNFILNIKRFYLVIKTWIFMCICKVSIDTDDEKKKEDFE